MKTNCIIMRNGSEFWISEEKAKAIADILLNQKSSQFIRIAELDGRVINTADVVEICTQQQMEDRVRIKNKEFQCAYKKWHARGEKCTCAYEINKAKKEEKERQEMAESMRPQTPEEREKTRKALAETRRILEDKGILTKKMTIEHESENK